jgi:hypothetical protein
MTELLFILRLRMLIALPAYPTSPSVTNSNSTQAKHISRNYLYCCTVDVEDSLSIAHPTNALIVYYILV